MTDDEFRRTMIDHMEQQTKFLCGISEGMQAVRMFGRFVKYIGGIISTAAGIFGLWTFLTKH